MRFIVSRADLMMENFRFEISIEPSVAAASILSSVTAFEEEARRGTGNARPNEREVRMLVKLLCELSSQLSNGDGHFAVSGRL